jgi:hypothetical protein
VLSHEGDERPWDKPGAVRRDGEPHRGPVLLFLGRVSLIAGIVSFCTAAVVPVVPVLACIGVGAIALGSAVLLTANRDLARMSKGLMDPAGAAATNRAGLRAGRGLVFATLGVGAWLSPC